MTDDENAFLSAIAAARQDRGLRGVYADWLDGHDRPADADYQRRWTAEVGAAEDWLADYAGQTGLTYAQVLGAARRFAETGAETGTGHNFEPGNVLAGLDRGPDGKRRREPDHGETLAAFWRSVELVLGRSVTDGRKQLDPFVCCEWGDGIDDEGW